MAYRELTKDELSALAAFARENGKRWKSTLSNVYWYNARLWMPRGSSDNFQGSLLHGLRNDLGPSWLAQFKFQTAPGIIGPARYSLLLGCFVPA